MDSALFTHGNLTLFSLGDKESIFKVVLDTVTLKLSLVNTFLWTQKSHFGIGGNNSVMGINSINN